MGQLDAWVKQLDKDLKGIEGSIPEKEYNKRYKMVGDLGNKQRHLVTSAQAGSFARDELLSGGGRGGAAHETEQTIGLDSQGMMRLQQRSMETQDDQLDKLGDSIVRQKEVAVAISDELTLHAPLLNDIYEGTERVKDHQKVEMKRLDKIMRKSKNSGTMCIIFLLILAVAACIYVLTSLVK